MCNKKELLWKIKDNNLKIIDSIGKSYRLDRL